MTVHIPPKQPVPSGHLLDILSDAPEALDQLYNLFTAVRQSLDAQGRGHFLLPKSKAHFHAPLKRQGGFIIGAKTAQGGLDGFCVVMLHDTLWAAQAAGHVSIPGDYTKAQQLCGDGPVAVVQSLCVAPGACGKRLAREILACVARETQGKRRLAQASLANFCGWKSFMMSHYAVVACGEEKSAEGVATEKLLLCGLTAPEHQAWVAQSHRTLPQQGQEVPLQALYQAVGSGDALVLTSRAKPFVFGLVGRQP